MSDPIPLLKIIDVYGDTMYVGREDFERAKFNVALRHRNGVKYSDDSRGGRNGRCTMLAKANVASFEAILED